jgi:hypothetical protein
MNTATQLLERVKAVMSMTDLEDIGLFDEIEAYLAKQQVETLKPLGKVYRWIALKDGKPIYQYSDQGYPALFKKSVVTLPTKPEQQVEQEPVAYRLKNLDIDGNFDGLHCYYDLIELKKIPPELEPLYTSRY